MHPSMHEICNTSPLLTSNIYIHRQRFLVPVWNESAPYSARSSLKPKQRKKKSHHHHMSARAASDKLVWFSLMRKTSPSYSNGHMVASIPYANKVQLQRHTNPFALWYKFSTIGKHISIILIVVLFL